MAEPISLFNYRQAKNQQDEIVAALAEKNWLFVTQACWVVCEVARQRQEFTTDAIWFLLLRRGVDVAQRKTMSAVMKKMIKDGVVVMAGRRHKSVMTTCHARPKEVYRSLIYQPQ